MKICLISVEIFAWGKYGGFGRSTRMIGRELVKRGVDVTAVVPLRPGQKPVEVLDGIRVLGFDPRQPLSAISQFRQANADIYHSQEPSFGTFLARKAMPNRRHVVTFRDTRNLQDWWVEFLYPSLSHTQVLLNFLYEDSFLVHHAVRQADQCCAASKMLISKARKKYGLSADPTFLPSPVPFSGKIQKSEHPLVCFVGRLDRRKRPQVFFELAKKFPNVQFEAVGGGRDSKWEKSKLAKYQKLPNLKIHGFIDQFDDKGVSDLLGKSWILVNTSARESLPTTFIEAAVHGCAILSGINPDGWTSDFGHHVTNDDYARGLQNLLDGNTWQEKGQRASEYSQNTFSLDVSMEKHISLYRDLL